MHIQIFGSSLTDILNGIPPPTNKLDFNGSNYTDIKAVSYLSDGKFLNSTFRLFSPLYNDTHPSGVFIDEITYGMLIDADSNMATGLGGVEYKLEISNVGLSFPKNSWMQRLYELSSTGDPMILKAENYTGFLDRNYPTKILPISLDLRLINFPEKYRVSFFAQEAIEYGGSRHMSENYRVWHLDSTGWIDVPPPVFSAVTLPSPLVLRQGEQKIVPIQMKSTASSSIKILNLTIEKASVGPYDLKVAVNQVNPPSFAIKVPTQTPVGIYDIPIVGAMSLESELPFSNINSSIILPGLFGEAVRSYPTIPTNGSISGLVNLTLTVLEPKTTQEQFKDFWDTYGQPISIIAGGFAGGVASLVFDRFKKTKKVEDTNLDDYKNI